MEKANLLHHVFKLLSPNIDDIIFAKVDQSFIGGRKVLQLPKLIIQLRSILVLGFELLDKLPIIFIKFSWRIVKTIFSLFNSLTVAVNLELFVLIPTTFSTLPLRMMILVSYTIFCYNQTSLKNYDNKNICDKNSNTSFESIHLSKRLYSLCNAHSRLWSMCLFMTLINAH